jgi:3alpha(or 20beta)-hydroxysteroid dehydrogenase
MGALDGKVVMITGASGGQGLAEARLFAREGASLVLTDIVAADEPPVGVAAKDALMLVHDVASEAAWSEAVERALARFGRVDALVNNAGVYQPASLSDTGPDLYDFHYRVNQLGVFLGMRAVLPAMAARGVGSIINIASGAGAKGTNGLFAYSTTKWAVRGMTRSAARELAPKGIRVNALLPGLIDTPMVSIFPKARNDDFVTRVPLGRIGEAMDVAQAALFLASDASAYITGAEIPVDGGYLA